MTEGQTVVKIDHPRADLIGINGNLLDRHAETLAVEHGVTVEEARDALVRWLEHRADVVLRWEWASITAEEIRDAKQRAAQHPRCCCAHYAGDSTRCPVHQAVTNG